MGDRLSLSHTHPRRRFKIRAQIALNTNNSCANPPPIFFCYQNMIVICIMNTLTIELEKWSEVIVRDP